MSAPSSLGPARKTLLAQAFARLLEERLRALESSLSAARDGTRLDLQDRPANRGERAAVSAEGYLAEALATRLQENRDARVLLDRVLLTAREEVAPGALVTLTTAQGGRRVLFLVPGGQGEILDTPEGPVSVLSPVSALGRALRGSVEGDRVPIEGGEVEILEVE